MPVCQPGFGPTLGTWPSWLKGQVKGIPSPGDGGMKERAHAQRPGLWVWPCGGRPGSRGHCCLSFRAWFYLGWEGMGRRFCRRQFYFWVWFVEDGFLFSESGMEDLRFERVQIWVVFGGCPAVPMDGKASTLPPSQTFLWLDGVSNPGP